MMLLAEVTKGGWDDPSTWMQIVDRFGVAVMVIFGAGLFVAFCVGCIWAIYRSWEPLFKAKVTQMADAHSKFVTTAAESIDIHAKANATHASAHAVSAESLKAISEAVEESIDSHRSRLSDLVRMVHGGFTAIGDGLQELEEMHKDNPPMLKAIARFRTRIAGMREDGRRKKESDSDNS